MFCGCVLPSAGAWAALSTAALNACVSLSLASTPGGRACRVTWLLGQAARRAPPTAGPRPQPPLAGAAPSGSGFRVASAPPSPPLPALRLPRSGPGWSPFCRPLLAHLDPIVLGAQALPGTRPHPAWRAYTSIRETARGPPCLWRPWMSGPQCPPVMRCSPRGPSPGENVFQT